MSVKFTALVSKDLKHEYDEAIKLYQSGLNNINGVDSNLVKQRAAILVQ